MSTVKGHMSHVSFVFFGTDDFSVIVLETLKEAGFLPACIVTAPDRPKGRGLKLVPPPVKDWALKNNIPFLQPESLSDPDFIYNLQTTNYELFIVASYGLIIPKRVLDIPPRGTLNVHPSLLPRYRGATPIENQILNAEKEIGVTIMRMDERMDHGPIVASQRLEITNHNNQILPLRGISQSETNKSQIPNGNQNTQTPTQPTWPPKAGEVRKMLAEEGGKLLADVLPKWVAGTVEAVSQDESKATYTKKLEKKDGELDLSDEPYKNFLKIRAFDASIGTYFFYSPLEKGALHSDAGGMSPAFSTTPTLADSGTPFTKGDGGKIRVIIKDALFEEGKLKILRVVPEGKREMGYDEFIRGFRS